MDTVDDQGDGDYVVTADMLIHQDIDDERTLEEEEDADDSYEEEIQELQKEQDIPLEELLASYYGGLDNVNSMPDTSLAVETNDHVEINEEDPAAVRESSLVKDPSPVHVPPDLLLPPGLMDDANDSPSTKPDSSSISSSSGGSGSSNSGSSKPLAAGSKRKGPWFRSGANPEALARLRPVPERLSLRLYAEDGINSTFDQWLRGSDHASSSSDNDDDCSDDWRKEIKVGRDHQASVPLLVANQPYSSSSSRSGSGTKEDTMLWSPDQVSDKVLDKYLLRVSNEVQENDGLPLGSRGREDEHALFTLLSCDFDVDKAASTFRRHVSKKHGVSSWTDEECQKFESGLKAVGKNFHLLQKQIPTRSVKELIEYYYSWKKTEQYDQFIQCGRIGKKKYAIPPGYLSDFMDDYLEPSRTSFPELHYGTTTLSAEVKKDKYLSMDRLCHAHHNKGHTHQNKSIATRTS